MSNYTFTLLIDSLILNEGSSDNFCIAKKVDGTFTTVFQDAAIKPKNTGQKTLITQNDFQWQDRYRVFCTATYTHGMLVRSATNNVEVAFGQETIYQGNTFTDAATANRDDFINASGLQSYQDSFLAQKIPKTLHAAVECFVGGAWASVYVDPDNHVGTMDKQLTPMNEYMLFWSSRVQTNSMIDESKFETPFTFNFDNGVKNKTVRYGYATPDKPSANEDPNFYAA
ncbi:hypothetical protein AAFC00_005037 [Neodothiora populina]|uniref:Uncharacterized protein n=1 Tax=Neodothiora populina TaxID=2781224 RepID=A0ABR3P468_9PEZI